VEEGKDENNITTSAKLLYNNVLTDPSLFC